MTRRPGQRNRPADVDLLRGNRSSRNLRLGAIPGHPAGGRSYDVAKTAKKHGISEQTLYTWRKKFGGMGTDELKRLRQLETDSARLKKMVAERNLEIEVMQEIARKKW